VRILSIESEVLIISLSASGQVRTLPRAIVTSVRLLPEIPVVAMAADAAPQVPTAPPRRRHVALDLGIAPGFDLDVEAGLFHGFANLGVVLPLASNGQIVPVSFGLGIGIPLSRRLPTLKLDVFAHVDVVWDVQGNNDYSGSGNSVGFGAGLGLHYTWNNGLTLGFTIPILGYSVQFGQTPWPGSTDTGTAVANYFLLSSEALPLAYIGYRF
jgi:hypothetical protein